MKGEKMKKKKMKTKKNSCSIFETKIGILFSSLFLSALSTETQKRKKKTISSSFERNRKARVKSYTKNSHPPCFLFSAPLFLLSAKEKKHSPSFSILSISLSLSINQPPALPLPFRPAWAQRPGLLKDSDEERKKKTKNIAKNGKEKEGRVEKKKGSFLSKDASTSKTSTFFFFRFLFSLPVQKKIPELPTTPLPRHVRLNTGHMLQQPRLGLRRRRKEKRENGWLVMTEKEDKKKEKRESFFNSFLSFSSHVETKSTQI